jgi:putative ABC transport system substrate-binding protein
MRRIGVLMTGFSNAEVARFILDPFREGLRELGWIEGQNIGIEYRFANGKPDLLPELASELARLRSEVVVTEGWPAAQAAKNASSNIAVVMATSGDLLFHAPRLAFWRKHPSQLICELTR